MDRVLAGETMPKDVKGLGDGVLREALHSLSSKLGVEPVLLPLRRNFDLEPMGPEEAGLDLQVSITDRLNS
jgi:hypothetical protein